MKKLKRCALLGLTLLLCRHVMAQITRPDNNIKLFFEKVFIHTDRNVYAANEDIWYKAYVTNAQDNHLIGTSKNLYIELISPEDTLVNKEIIRIDNGTGKGDFKLPENLSSGTYRLRAYTNWMRNFGNNFIFEKSITIAGHNTDVKKNPGNRIAGKKSGKANTMANTAQLRFFPEGGSLVEDVSAIVAVKAEDAGGRGFATTGAILSATGDTVTHFTCDSLGFGLFAMLPMAGQTYHATATYNKAPLSAPLPQALSKGLSLKVSQKDTLIYIIVRCNSAALAGYAGKTLTLSGKYTGQSIFQQDFQLSNAQVELKIPVSTLPEGIIAFRLADDQHKPNCERLFYVRNPNKTKLLVTTAKSVYQSREKVTVKIKAYNAGNQPVKGNFSLSAIDGSIGGVNDGDIQSYLMLQSEIVGPITHPARYFDTTNVNRFKQLDQLLLTQGWRDFVWKRIADTAIKISYLPEQGFSLSGNVKRDFGGKPIAGANITLAAPNARGAKLLFTQTDANGNYYFDNLLLFGEQNIKVSSRDDKAKALGMIKLDSLSKNSLPLDLLNLADDVAISPNAINELSRRAPLNKPQDSIIALREVKIKGRNVVSLRDQTAVGFGYPDEVLTPSPKDYTFNNLREYIVYASKQAKIDPNSDEIIFYADGVAAKPRIIIDNKADLFTDDSGDDIKSHYYNTYYNLPMNVVNKVTIRRLLSAPKLIQGPPGAANATGNSVAASRVTPITSLFVIYLNLKPNALEKPQSSVTHATLNGYYETRTFYKPLHLQPEGGFRRPDLRTTIHWEPEINTDDNGTATISFYNADPKTQIKVMVQGVASNGTPLATTSTYTVR